ncbi:helix-turn-helix transcriptional regulator [Tundrisphaera lichenicola]|uniref:helix-turn-helix transcriptional regulator n=1 Tax=Tundrisphaera lichenicola TaxID=2029860 RepID=UPI003EB9A117
MSRHPKQGPVAESGDRSVRGILDSHLAGRLTLRLDELAKAIGVSRRTIERERSAGRFPAPDIKVGKAPLWKPETILKWIDGGGR